MKTLMTVSLLGAALLMAAPAQAYMVYNHIDSQLCIIDAGDPTMCNYTVPADGSRQVPKGFARADIWANWNAKPGVCYLTERFFGVPEGGTLKAYKDKVEVYGKGGKLVTEVGFRKQTCAQRQVK